MRLDDGQIELMDDAMVESPAPHDDVAAVGRLRSACGNYTRKRVEAAVRWLHPDCEEAAVRREITRRMLREPI